MSSRFFIVALVALATGLSVLAQQTTTAAPQQQQQRTTKAVVVVFPASGSSVSGTIYLEQTDAGVRVTGEIKGLAPNSKHGFHIHEFGDMTKTDATSMGGHFNPAGAMHGLPDNTMRHAGDMGNVTADANGIAKVDQVFQGMTLAGRSGILGRGLVVHEKPDDGGQPTGNAGGRIGYGVIAVAQVATQ